MATEKDLHELLGRAMVDEDFRKALGADPAAATATLGISLTEEQLAALKATDFSQMSGAVDERLSKAWRPGLW
jgi:hypothetical protein